MKVKLLLSFMLMCVPMLCFGNDVNLQLMDNDDVITAPGSIESYQKLEQEKVMMNFLKQTLDESDMKAVTNIQVQTGLSNMYGEFVRLRLNIGRREKAQISFSLYGGVGKDWVFKEKNPDYIKDPFTNKAKKKIEWHAGIGMMVTLKRSNLSLLMDYCQTSYVPNNNFCMNIQMEYAYYFLNNRLGAFASAGAAMYLYKVQNKTDYLKTGVKFAFSVGLTYRFF